MARMTKLRLRKSEVWCAGWLIGLILAGAPVHAAEDAGLALDLQVQKHLEAGEFGPAIEAANKAPTDRIRNELLGRIAVRQSDAGAYVGASSTLARMTDDEQRRYALDSMMGSPTVVAPGAYGGVSVDDFQPLIDLITSTIAPTTWEDEGGNGAIEPFVAGVYVDAEGTLRRVTTGGPERLEMLRRTSVPGGPAGDVRRASELRKVSLNRLEREVQLRWLAGQEPDDAMRHLAGLTRIRYVFLYPDTGDVVIAGPAAGWHADPTGHDVSDLDGRPVLQLDDLVLMLRHAADRDATFGCSINPRPAHLERAQQFLRRSSAAPLTPGRRDAWLGELRETVGRQDIEIFGIEPRSHAARVLVEADYHMKLVGIGLESGTIGVPSYLHMVAEGGGGEGMSVLRWWFAMDYDAVRVNDDRTAFELVGRGVKLLSENEMLRERGRLESAGKSDEANQRFADAFTSHYDELSVKYPLYAELRNLFDLSLVAQLVHRESLADRASWHMRHFADPSRYQIALGEVPREVDSVVNSVEVNRRRFIAAVSGGVWANPRRWIDPQAIQKDTTGRVQYAFQNAAADERPLDRRQWWWD